jgi:hypothetical protein
MDKFQQAILDFFDNKQLLKDIRTGSILLLILLIPLFWFGFKDTLVFNSLWSWSFGSAIVVITLSIYLATTETKTRAYDDRFTLNTELQKIHNDIQDNSVTIKQLDKKIKRSIKWCNEYNKDQQDMYNEIKTNNKIDILEKRAIKYRIRGKEKRATSCDYEIDKLNDNPLIDKRFKPYDIKRLLTIEKRAIKFNKQKGDNEINSNPKHTNIGTILLGMPIRALGVGMFGAVPFIIDESPGEVILFYIAYLLTMAITIITQYLITQYKMEHGFITGLGTIKRLQEMLIEDLQSPPQLDI